MKKFITFTILLGCLFAAFTVSAQQMEDKSKRPSPPDTVKATTSNGVAIEVAYSQPSVKGRAIGKEIAPYGQVWRTGANEATTISFSKPVTINGKSLAAGKYSLYSIPGEKNWVVIFNKTWKQWGTVYKQGEDALRVTTTTQKAPSFQERLKFNVEPSGMVSFTWGDDKVGFTVK